MTKVGAACYICQGKLTHTTVTHYTCCPYTLTKMVWCVSNCLQGCICHQSSRYHMQVTGKHRIYMVCCFGVQNAQIVTEPTCVCIHVAPILAGPACRSIMDHNEEWPWVHYAYKLMIVQWNPSNQDTNGAEDYQLGVLGVKLHARTVLGGNKRVSLLERCPRFRGVIREGFPISTQLLRERHPQGIDQQPPQPQRTGPIVRLEPAKMGSTL